MARPSTTRGALMPGGAAAVAAALLPGSLSSCKHLGLSGSSSIFAEQRLLHPKMGIGLEHPLDTYRSATMSFLAHFE
jgi:hypothetical protein